MRFTTAPAFGPPAAPKAPPAAPKAPPAAPKAPTLDQAAANMSPAAWTLLTGLTDPADLEAVRTAFLEFCAQNQSLRLPQAWEAWRKLQGV